jgi:hypothetical protein
VTDDRSPPSDGYDFNGMSEPSEPFASPDGRPGQEAYADPDASKFEIAIRTLTGRGEIVSLD